MRHMYMAVAAMPAAELSQTYTVVRAKDARIGAGAQGGRAREHNVSRLLQELPSFYRARRTSGSYIVID